MDREKILQEAKAELERPEIAELLAARLCCSLWPQQTMAALSQDSIDWVTALHKRNHRSPSCAKVVKRLQDGTPDIHNKIFFGMPIEEMLQTFYHPGECGFLLVSQSLVSARVEL